MKTKPFNPVDYLQASQIPSYLTTAYHDVDPKVFLTALGFVIKNRGVAQIAKQTGLNRESLYKIVRGESEPKWSTLHLLLNALGVEIKITM